MPDIVRMNVKRVTEISETINGFGATLRTVAQIMAATSIALKTTAWISAGASTAAAAYLDKIQPQVKNAAEKMGELAHDLKGAVAAYEKGDFSGSRRFV